MGGWSYLPTNLAYTRLVLTNSANIKIVYQANGILSWKKPLYNKNNKIANKLALKHNALSWIFHSFPKWTGSGTRASSSLSYLGDDGIHLLHAQGDDARKEGLEHLARFLYHHLQDL